MESYYDFFGPALFIDLFKQGGFLVSVIAETTELN